MKTIIACTDFSSSSLNACRYAASIAKETNCKLLLFNLFDAPVIHSNAGLYGIAFAANQNISLQKSSKLLNNLKEEFPNLKISYFVTSGSFTEQLKELSSRHRVSAAVMGLKAKSSFAKFISGTRGVKVVGEIKAPVIIVPETYKKHRLKKILLGVDNNEKITKASLKQFNRFAQTIQADVKPLYIRTEMELFKPMQKAVSVKNQTKAITTIEAASIKEGILKYAKKNEIDLIAILSKDHSPIFNFFSESNTKAIAFAAKIPVIAVHED
jgi:nucleotide-binding universal stress UspA family protein